MESGCGLLIVCCSADQEKNDADYRRHDPLWSLALVLQFVLLKTHSSVTGGSLFDNELRNAATAQIKTCWNTWSGLTPVIEKCLLEAALLRHFLPHHACFDL